MGGCIHVWVIKSVKWDGDLEILLWHGVRGSDFGMRGSRL